MTTDSNKPMSTGGKLAVGGLGLALIGGIFAAFGGGKKPTPAAKPLGKSCGPCGR